MENLTAEEAMSPFEKTNSELSYYFISDPIFPKSHKDVCVVRCIVKYGSNNKYDIIYLVWKENGQICNKEIKNSRVTQEHIYIKSIVVGNDGNLSVRFGSSGSYTIVAWEDKSAVNL